MLVCWTAVYNFSLAFGGSVKIVVMPKGNAVQAVLYDKTRYGFDMAVRASSTAVWKAFGALRHKELKGAL